MNGAFYIGATGLRSQERALEVIANNISNINTTAFKRSEVRFSELMATPASPTDATLGVQDHIAGLSGVAVDASPSVFAQGDLKATGKPLDVAITGDGFIELMAPGGQVQLWRGGSLKINQDGYLAADSDLPLKAMISVPTGATAISIDQAGNVQAIANGATQPTTIGKIDLVMPKDITTLEALGNGLYRPANETDLISAAPGEEGLGTLVQGSVETSNVQLSDEMVTLLIMQRAYGANAQVIQAGDQMMSIANSLRR